MGSKLSLVVKEIKSMTSIVEVVSTYVQLRNVGGNHVGLCPFHSEKTPSFKVRESAGRYKCFGCGAHGDVIDFLQALSGKSFSEVVLDLASQYGINTDGAIDTSRIDLSRKVGVVHRYARNNLKMVRNYLDARKIPMDVADEFQLGYIPPGYRPKEDLSPLGFISSNNNFLFRNRITFPFFAGFSDPVSFSARTINRGNAPKYINGSESPIFKKGNVLFGMNLIQVADHLHLVEGPTDVISMTMAGLKAVGKSGTALSKQQCQMIKTKTNTVVVVGDGDEAGVKATGRDISMLLSEGLDVMVSVLPKGEDPDSIRRSKGESALKRSINPVMWQSYYKGLNQDNSSIRTAIENIIEIEDKISVDLNIREISATFGVRINSVWEIYHRLRKERWQSMSGLANRSNGRMRFV
jgi:DNA primase